MTPTEIVLAAVAAIFVDFSPQAAEPLLAPDYIQHNVAVPTGAAPILGVIPVLQDSGIQMTIHRVVAQDDLVVLHSTYDNAQLFGGDTLVAFDVFRVADGQVVEHWDNLQPLAPPNPSGRSMVDGPTQISDPALTAENRALVQGFVRDVLLGAAPDRITDYISTEAYHQHNPMIGDGLPALGAAFQALADAGQAITYDETHLIVAEGDFVFTASEGHLGETPTAFFDLFRVADGRIVEHWDTIAEIPAEMPHDNGKF